MSAFVGHLGRAQGHLQCCHHPPHVLVSPDKRPEHHIKPVTLDGISLYHPKAVLSVPAAPRCVYGVKDSCPDQGPCFLPTIWDTRKAWRSPGPHLLVSLVGNHGGKEGNLRGEESVYYLANAVLLIPWIYPLSSPSDLCPCPSQWQINCRQKGQSAPCGPPVRTEHSPDPTSRCSPYGMLSRPGAEGISHPFVGQVRKLMYIFTQQHPKVLEVLLVEPADWQRPKPMP